MKWLTRKPSSAVQYLVAAACAAILGASPDLISSAYPGYHSRITDWVKPVFVSYYRVLPTFIFQDPGLDSDTYFVAESEGQIIALHWADEGCEALWQDPETFEMCYFVGSYQTGLWAPTRWIDAQILSHAEQSPGKAPVGRNMPSLEQILERQAVLVAIKGLDPRLATSQYVADTHIIWSGFVVNGVCLLAISGIVWSFAWVPVKFRDNRRRTRAEQGLCPMCAYDVHATPGACPECGWGHAKEADEHARKT
ncbi:MAG: hypothetical protein IID31_12340 [Planctomycetes bacterium]|nr:hypothetical protein [Planctomycetota bacterium]